MMEAVRAHVARGEEPLLVVPTAADQARYRRELAEGGLVLGARVERFQGLLAEIVKRAGQARRREGPPLGTLARERMLARLSDARPGLAREIARVIADIEAQRITPARLRGALDVWRAEQEGPDGELASLERLGDVFERYRQTLVKMHRTDPELRVTRSLDELRRTPALWGSTPVLLYGFDDFSDLQLDAIETLGVVVGGHVTVSLAYEPGRVAFAGRAATFQRLSPLADSNTVLAPRAEYYARHARDALHHLERSLLGEEITRVEPGEAVRLLQGGSPRAELELVAGEIRSLLDAGVPGGEIAIVHRAPDSIAQLLQEVLEDFEIPHAAPRRVMFAHTAGGRALLGLLRLALGEGDLNDLLAWLGAPGVLDRPELANRLERRARRTGALDGARAVAMWEEDHWPIDRIGRLRDAATTGAQALAEALTSELEWLFLAPRRASASVLGEDHLDEARALHGARRALEELRDLGRSAPDLAPTPAEMAEALEELELSRVEGLDANRVAVLDPLSLRARRVRMVFACGLQEGVFPAHATPHPLLSEEARRKLASSSGLVLRPQPDALAAERYLLYALASRPEERLTLSWHTADENGAPLAPSLFVDDVCDLFADTLRERASHRFAGSAGWPGPGRPAGAMAIREQAIERASAGRRVRPIAALADEHVLGELRDRSLWSASALEAWAGCPVKWFVERLLRARDLAPDPEPIARGGLAHAALKQTLEGLRARTGSARLTPASVGLAKRMLGESLSELQDSYPLSVAPERLPGARRRLHVDLERYLEHAAEQQSRLEPAYLELEFGFDEPREESLAASSCHSEPPSAGSLPALDLGEGVRLRGRIDRVDIGSAGEAVVYDYKGRSAPPAARWVGDGALQVALYMRAVEKLLGHAPAGGLYQPLAGRDIRARGVLDADSGLELECVRTDVLERPQLEELLDACVALASRAAAQARSGALEPRPDTCAYGGGCAYPTICRCER
jgi:hypothetical protein